jgi:hypothetical protein
MRSENHLQLERGRGIFILKVDMPSIVFARHLDGDLFARDREILVQRSCPRAKRKFPGGRHRRFSRTVDRHTLIAGARLRRC